MTGKAHDNTHFILLQDPWAESTLQSLHMMPFDVQMHNKPFFLPLPQTGNKPPMTFWRKEVLFLRHSEIKMNKQQQTPKPHIRVWLPWKCHFCFLRLWNTVRSEQTGVWACWLKASFQPCSGGRCWALSSGAAAWLQSANPHNYNTPYAKISKHSFAVTAKTSGDDAALKARNPHQILEQLRLLSFL